MTRCWKLFTAAITVLLLTIIALLLTVTHWLPRLAGIWLPADTAILLDGNLHWRDDGIELSGVHYRVGNCELATVSDLSLGRGAGTYTPGKWMWIAGVPANFPKTTRLQ